MTLEQLSPGRTARILTVGGREDTAVHLGDLGFVPGAPVACLFSHPLGVTRAYRVGDTVVALRNTVASAVTVEP